MIHVTTTPPPTPPNDPKKGEAFNFSFGSGNSYKCLVIDSNRVVIIGVGNNQTGWEVGHLTTLGETWNALTAANKVLYTKVTIHLEP